MNLSLNEKLSNADKFHQKQKFLLNVFEKIPYLLGIFLLILISDCLIHFSDSSRFAIDFLLISLIVILGVWNYFAIAKKRNSQQNIARLIESKAPEFGSSIINTIQLSEKLNDKNITPLSRELTLKAIEQYNARFNSSEFISQLQLPALPKQKKKSLIYLMIFLVILVAGFKITKNELLRFLDPFGNHPPFSLTTLQITSPLSTDTLVVYGSSKQIIVSYHGHKPDELFLSYYDPSTPLLVNTLPMFFNGKQNYVQEIKNIKSPLIVFAHSKNKRSQSEQLRLKVNLIPDLKISHAQIIPPEYTGLETTKRKYEFKPLTVLKKTKVQFDFESNRPLQSGIITVTPDNGKPFQVELKPIKNNMVSGTITFETTSNIKLKLIDTDNNSSVETWESIITIQMDVKPNISITNPSSDSFITEDFKLNAMISMNDDYGLAKARIHRALNGAYTPPKIFVYPLYATSMDQNYLFDIKDLGVLPGDVISFYADVVDNCPYEPHLVSTDIIHLTVVSVEEYNNYLRERTTIEDMEDKYQELEDQLEKLMKEQDKITEQLTKLEEKAKDDSLSPEEYQKELMKELLKQSELTDKINKLADEMKETVRDNPLFDVEEEFKRILEKESERIKKVTENHRQELDKLSDEISEGKSKENLSKTLKNLRMSGEKLKKELKKSEEKIEEEIVDAIQDLSLLQPLLDDLNHFQDLYLLQESIVKKLESYRNKESLSKEDILALRNLSESEQDIANELKSIMENLEKNAGPAEKEFPNSAKSARQFAQKMKNLELTELGNIAARNLSIPDQKLSYNAAENLRQKMDILFDEASNCEGGQCKPEHDKYLSLKKNIPPKNNFEQMCQNKGKGKGKGKGAGAGAGGEGSDNDGSSFYSGSPRMGLLGNEKFSSESKNSAKQNPSGRGRDGKAINNNEGFTVEHTKEFSASELQKNVKSNSEGKNQNKYSQYQEIIDAYFESLNK